MFKKLEQCLHISAFGMGYKASIVVNTDHVVMIEEKLGHTMVALSNGEKIDLEKSFKEVSKILCGAKL